VRTPGRYIHGRGSFWFRRAAAIDRLHQPIYDASIVVAVALLERHLRQGSLDLSKIAPSSNQVDLHDLTNIGVGAVAHCAQASLSFPLVIFLNRQDRVALGESDQSGNWIQGAPFRVNLSSQSPRCRPIKPKDLNLSAKLMRLVVPLSFDISDRLTIARRASSDIS
jgi:hypothetical protein